MKQANGMRRAARHLALAGLVCAAVAVAAGAARAESDVETMIAEQNEKMREFREAIHKARLEIAARWAASTNGTSSSSARLVSQKLLEKRVDEAKDEMSEATAQAIYVSHTNLDAKISAVRKTVVQNIEEESAEAKREAARYAKNQEVWGNVLAHALKDDWRTECFNTSIVITASSDTRLDGIYLTYDKEAKGNYVTNALYGIANYSIKDAATGDVTYRFITEDGEVYNSIPGVETNKYNCRIYTTVCSTNVNRVLKFRSVLLDDPSYNIIMGRE